jgi:hypothetical protein
MSHSRITSRQSTGQIFFCSILASIRYSTLQYVRRKITNSIFLTTTAQDDPQIDMDPPEFHLREATATTPSNAARLTSRVKPPPQSTAISAPFSYSPSDDGTDENLLILLHGLGSHGPSFLRNPISFSFAYYAAYSLNHIQGTRTSPSAN